MRMILNKVNLYPHKRSLYGCQLVKSFAFHVSRGTSEKFIGISKEFILDSDDHPK
jgi:hypothetical protein